MNILEERQGGVTIIRPDGPLLKQEADQFRRQVLHALAGSCGRCVIDASALAYIDSRGLEVLVEANEEASASGQSLKLCGVTETVRRVLELTRLSTLFEFFADVNAATRSFS
jgi:anti-anti-sigma factor